MLGFREVAEMTDNKKAIEMIDKITRKAHGCYVPEIKNAYEIISNRARERAEEIYGVPLHKKISKRLEWELDAIKERHHEIYFYITEQLVRKTYENGYVIFPYNDWGASLVAYLLGITDINPLPLHYVCDGCRHLEFTHTCDDKLCPECGAELRVDGYDLAIETLLADGSRVPDLQISIPAELRNECEEILCEILSSEKIIRCEGATKNTEYYYILPKSADIDTGNNTEFLNDHFIRISIVTDPHITLLNELKRRTGMAVECDVSAVFESTRKEASIFADDIIRELTSHGVPAFLAYRFMKTIKRGALKPGAKYDGWVDTLSEYGVSTEYIASLSEIAYLPTKAETVSKAKIERALAVYDKHYAQEFMEACEKYGVL